MFGEAIDSQSGAVFATAEGEDMPLAVINIEIAHVLGLSGNLPIRLSLKSLIAVSHCYYGRLPDRDATLARDSQKDQKRSEYQS